MKHTIYIPFLIIFLTSNCAPKQEKINPSPVLSIETKNDDNEIFLSYIVNPNKQKLAFYWKDDKSKRKTAL